MKTSKTKSKPQQIETSDGARKFFTTLLMLFAAVGLFIFVGCFALWLALKDFSLTDN